MSRYMEMGGVRNFSFGMSVLPEGLKIGTYRKDCCQNLDLHQVN